MLNSKSSNFNFIIYSSLLSLIFISCKPSEKLFLTSPTFNISEEYLILYEDSTYVICKLRYKEFKYPLQNESIKYSFEYGPEIINQGSYNYLRDTLFLNSYDTKKATLTLEYIEHKGQTILRNTVPKANNSDDGKPRMVERIRVPLDIKHNGYNKHTLQSIKKIIKNKK